MITVIGNMKGGTGKSTVTFNLSVWFVCKNKTIQLFDLDPQKTLTDVVEVRSEEEHTPEIPMPLNKSKLRNIKSIASKVDEVLMDVSMSDAYSLDKALKVADRVLIPIAPSQADVWSTQRFLKNIYTLRKDKMPKIYGIINRADTHLFVPETKEAEEAMDNLDLERIPVRLYNRTAYKRSFSEGLGVFELQPSSKASQEFKKLMSFL